MLDPSGESAGDGSSPGAPKNELPQEAEPDSRSSSASDGDASDSDSEETDVFEIEFTGEKPERLDAFLARQLSDYSRGFLQGLIEDGRVTIEPKPTRALRASFKLKAGLHVRVEVPPPVSADIVAEAIPIDILYQDEHIAVLNKQAGISMHPSPDQSGSTLVNALLHWIDDLSGIGGVERPGIVHRLDKETSGCLVIAKTDIAHRDLSDQFRDRTVQKTYHAIVRGEPRFLEGTVDEPLARHRTHRKKMAVSDDGNGRPSLTNFRVLEVFRSYALVECYPKTGRTHQIRVHMAHLKTPVSCDKLYGRERRVFVTDLNAKTRSGAEQPIIERQALHAKKLSFRHPATGEELTFTAPLHDDMAQFLQALRDYRAK